MNDERRYVQYLLYEGKAAEGWPAQFRPIGCGGCRYEFGFVHDPSKGSLGRGPAFDPDILLEPKKIYLWGAWQRRPVDGIVSFTKRAKGHLVRGAIAGRKRSYHDGPQYSAYSPVYDLPQELRCPLCNRREILDPVRLGADRVHRDANYETDASPKLSAQVPFSGRRGELALPEWRGRVSRVR